MHRFLRLLCAGLIVLSVAALPVHAQTVTGYAAVGRAMVITVDDTPTGGTTGANITGPGSLAIDTTNCVLYQNTGTKASPTWTQVNAVVGALIDIDLGSSGVAGSADLFPTTAASGKLRFTVVDNAANHTITVTNASHGQASTYSIPDCGEAAGQFVVTNAANSVIINPNAGDRTISLAGNVTFPGAVTLGGTLTTAGNLTFAGAFAAQITVPEANTWVLPAGGGTLALATGAETGTTAENFLVDSDSAAAKIALSTNAATGDFTLTLVPANLTADRTISFADASGTVMVLDNGGSQTAAGDFVWTGTHDFRGNISASTGNPTFDLSASTGTFKTSSGTNTIYGNLVTSGNNTVDWSSSSGTYKTSTGTNTLNGNVVIAGSKTLTTGTGLTTINGSARFAAGVDIDFAGAGDGTFDLSTQTGIFKTSTGTNTLGGNTAIAGAGTLTTGTGLTLISGDMRFAAGVDIDTAGAGDGTVDLSAQTGTFKTTTGAHTFGGACTIDAATTPSLTTAAGKTNTGFLKVAGKTSGSLILTTNDSTAQDTTVTLAAQTGGGAVGLAIPDVAAVAAQFMMTKGTNTCTGTYDLSGATVTYRSIVNADIAAGAAIARSKLVEEPLAKYGVSFGLLRNDDGTVVDATGGAGLFAITNGGIGTGTQTLDGEAASGNVKTDILQFEFALPPEYVAAGDVKVVITAKESVGAATVATTLSGEVYEDDGQGGVGANLLSAWDQTDITNSWQTFVGTITAASLTGGDKVRVYLQIVTDDTGAAVGTVAQIGKIEVQCDIKG